MTGETYRQYVAHTEIDVLMIAVSLAIGFWFGRSGRAAR